MKAMPWLLGSVQEELGDSMGKTSRGGHGLPSYHG